MAECFVFVGTYTEDIKFGTGEVLKGKGEGIYVFAFDLRSGVLAHLRTIRGIVNPSYVCLGRNNNFLYAVNELKVFEGKASGAVSSFSLDRKTLEMNFLSSRPSLGTDPCFICLNAAQSHAFATNFMSGSVSVFPVLSDGSLGEASQFIQHEGSGVHPLRQTGPHAHSLSFDNSNRFAFVPDLGIDRLVAYSFDAASGRLAHEACGDFAVPPGAGPRHCEFHPNGRFTYLINELASQIMVFKYEAVSGSLRAVQTVRTVPEGFAGENTAADIHVAPSGKFVYASNRGHDSLVIYRIDGKTGLLSYVGSEPCGGRTPRSFAIEPSGRFLLAANQDSDTVTVFRIDEGTGKLEEVFRVTAPTPVCVKCALL
ncbi:MAG: lactonase family protein [Spirochaetales bacterium]|jgi:6-phosphogluconolactonase|nr:lactonase family protein [Spirochaetales bacterium]